MRIGRANPWFCLGLAFVWLVLEVLSPARSEGVPTVLQIVVSTLFLYVLLLSAVVCTAATVPADDSPRRPGPATRVWRLFRADLLEPARRVPARTVLATGLETGVAIAMLSLALSFLIGWLTEAAGREVELQTVVDLFLRSAWPGRAALVVSVVLLTPVVEEFFFRYALESVLGGALRSRAKSLLYGAILFAAMHGNLAALPSLLVVSAGCSLAYRRAGSLLAPMLAHLFFNLFSVALLLAGAAG